MKYIHSFEFADIKVNLIVPTEVHLSDAWNKFQIDYIAEVDAEYEIRLLEHPLPVNGTKIGCFRNMDVYKLGDGDILRVFNSLTASDGCQVACYTNREQKNILYYPKAEWQFYAKELNLLHLIGIEQLLIQKNAFLLHSSVVKVNDKVVLFSGPSGVGKSTQASLWEQYLDAEILNGDRCVIRKLEENFYGCGSPWSGTSGIYSKEKAPLAGIFILKQAEQTSVRKLRAEAFAKLYEQTIVNTWDKAFVNDFVNLLTSCLECVPVYELACRKDKEAVAVAYKTLFGGDQ